MTVNEEHGSIIMACFNVISEILLAGT